MGRKGSRRRGGPTEASPTLPDLVEGLREGLAEEPSQPSLFPRRLVGTADDSLDSSSQSEADEDGVPTPSDGLSQASADSSPPLSTHLSSHLLRPCPDTADLPARPEPSSQRGSGGAEESPLWVTLGTLLSYGVLVLFGYLREFLRNVGLLKDAAQLELPRQRDFVPLFEKFESIYTRDIYMRVRDAWNRPIASVPGPHMDLLRRTTSDYCWTFQLTGGSQRVLNLGSYNYLGFAESSGPVCGEVKRRLRAEGLGTASAPHELGRPAVAAELDALVAEYVGTEAALTFPMGYATNSMNIPALVGPGCLILSDELNHASLITGCKLAQGSVKRLFRHNDMGDLERKLREALVAGQPRTRRPWRKVLIVAEGVYSMEGTIARLPHLIALKKRYKAFLWLDEAHSVGAMGPHGRGVLDYWGCDPRDVDLLMGTFTKSFAAAGGYVAGSKALVRWLRSQSAAQAYGTGLSPPVAQQILSSMRVMMGRAEAGEGAARVRSLARNARYFRRGLRQLGLVVLGHDDSPVIPVMLWTAPACSKFSRDLLKEHGIAVVVAAFPATPITLGRARFCVSSAHTKAMIDQALRAISLLGDEMHLKHARPPPLTGPIEY